MKYNRFVSLIFTTIICILVSTRCLAQTNDSLYRRAAWDFNTEIVDTINIDHKNGRIVSSVRDIVMSVDAAKGKVYGKAKDKNNKGYLSVQHASLKIPVSRLSDEITITGTYFKGNLKVGGSTYSERVSSDGIIHPLQSEVDAGYITLSNNSSSASLIERISIALHRRVLTVIAKDITREYGDAYPPIEIVYKGFMLGDSIEIFTKLPTVSTVADKFSDAGEYAIIVNPGNIASYKYILTYINGSLTVNKAHATAKVNDVEKTYGTTTPNFQITYEGLKNGESEPVWNIAPTISCSANESSSAGVYKISATGEAKNYNMDFIDGTLTINKVPLSITPNPASRKYGDANPEFSYTASGFVNGENESVLTSKPVISTTATNNSGVGTYPITAAGAQATNYNISYGTSELTITKRDLYVTCDSCSRFYGDQNPKFNFRYTTFVNNDNENALTELPVATTDATPSSDVGNYYITVTGGKSPNYNIITQRSLLTVKKAVLQAKPHDESRPYRSANPLFSLEYTGLKNNESVPVWITQPVLSTNATVESPAGSYDIYVSGGEARNYDVTYYNGVLNITKLVLNVSINNASRRYFESEPQFGCVYTGFVNGDDESAITTKPTLYTDASIYSNAGEYSILGRDGVAQNYDFSYKAGKLTIKKRDLSVKVEDCSRPYGEENPEFKLTYTGLVNGENESVFTKRPETSTSATRYTNVGTYGITVNGGEAANYSFTSYTNGTLTITKAYQDITWNQDLSQVQSYSQVRLEAEAPSGLPITYAIDNDTVCSLYKIGDYTYLDCFHNGSVTISAQQMGNGNYWPSTKVYKVANVGDYSAGIRDISVIGTDDSFIKVSDRSITLSGLEEGKTARIYTLSGALVYSGHDGVVPVNRGTYIIKVGGFVKKITVR